MPNFDTGHYFLTVLAPIKNGDINSDDLIGNTVEGKVSYRERLHFILSTLPTAFQSPATEWIPGITEPELDSTESSMLGTSVHYKANSPFARCHRTHLCRLVIIDDAIYNGRDQSNPIVDAVKQINPSTIQKADRLSNAYLMFATDFDAIMEKDSSNSLPNELSKQEQDAVRDDYARSLWEKMRTELERVFENCEHFDKVKSGDDFAQYIANCQVETTMPFNDYWDTPPKDPPLYEFPVKPAVITIIVLLGLFILGFFPWLNSTWLGSVTAKVLFGGGAIAAVLATYCLINSKAQNPMPAGKMASLRHVLKSLYLGKHFRKFVIKNQTESDEELYKNFGQFLEQHKPSSLTDATQPAGEVGESFRKKAKEKNT